MAEVYNSLFPGFQWTQGLQSSTDAFPSGSTWKADVRPYVGGELLTTLTTAANSIYRVSNTQITVTISGNTSNNWYNYHEIHMDFVRTDTDPDQHLGVRLTVPIVRSATHP